MVSCITEHSQYSNQTLPSPICSASQWFWPSHETSLIHTSGNLSYSLCTGRNHWLPRTETSRSFWTLVHRNHFVKTFPVRHRFQIRQNMRGLCQCRARAFDLSVLSSFLNRLLRAACTKPCQIRFPYTRFCGSVILNVTVRQTLTQYAKKKWILCEFSLVV